MYVVTRMATAYRWRGGMRCMSCAMSLVGISSAAARDRRRSRARQARNPGQIVEQFGDTPKSLAPVLLIFSLEYHLILNVRSV
jgi:hypothetical protein